MRAKGPVGKFGKAYGAAMRKAGAWRCGQCRVRALLPAAPRRARPRGSSYIKKIKKYYKKYGAGRKPLWDTEMNYGDTRTYMKVKRQYTGTTAATYVARTYIDSMRYGVYRVFWYGWDINVLGTDMTSRARQPDVRAARPSSRSSDWMVGKTWLGCKVKSSITTCTLVGRRPEQTIRVRLEGEDLDGAGRAHGEVRASSTATARGAGAGSSRSRLTAAAGADARSLT